MYDPNENRYLAYCDNNLRFECWPREYSIWILLISQQLEG